ncbi:sulfatase-like hydrolase/transferase [Helicobacter anatolicus]|uniref:sulfatase-like hydrolase/transferase n=1 Tax=Helicobacter anatolicus TaxID=2905874 RepID=UPI001E436B58|nr:sulfatase-like hydrolase/transferase [Helicobacter anatolicus]MCE3038829.1 sulfatase-like hydrolase/transferase [Helicobacter anatolicus]
MFYLKIFCVACIVFIVSLGKWSVGNFGVLTYEQILFHLKSPLLHGIPIIIILDFIKDCVLPIIVFCLAYFFVKKYTHKWIERIVFAGLMVIGIILAQKFWHFDTLYFEAKNIESYGEFYEKYYKQPQKSQIIFPEHKKNLIVIFTESMEASYANFKGQNLIPELDAIAKNNYSFNGLLTSREGGNDFWQVFGVGWTMAGIVGYSCGIPLNIPIGGNDLGKRMNSFLGGAICLGDILQAEGYRQVFMLPHKKKYSGIGAFIKTHGDMEIRDYTYFKKNNNLPKDHKGFWGIRDDLTFMYAKEALEQLGKNTNTPFALYILTIDTHAQDGYVDPNKCVKNFKSNYKNAIVCTDKIVGEFVAWLKKQDFYKDTTIFIVGDHLSMVQNFFPSDKKREIYNVFINPHFFHTFNPMYPRKISHFDFFPTILDSLGVEVRGYQIGLGVDLNAPTKTLLEKNIINEEMKKKSKIYDHFLFDTHPFFGYE